MLISVCVITCLRPEGLKRLLYGLNQQTFSKCPIPEIEVVLVDNDANGSAQEVYQTIKEEFNWQIKYYIEPKRGISYARNTAVSYTNENTSFVIWIDDDEVPPANWLDELLHVQQEYSADIVWGPISPHFVDKNVPNWVIEGKFFEPLSHPVGTSLTLAATNNVLVRAEIYKKHQLFFDERFALTGGSDTHFFWRASKMGFKIIWADQAFVDEWIPASRTKIQWLFQRAYRGGIVFSICESELEANWKLQLIRIVKGIIHILLGTIFLLPSLFLKRHILVRNLLKIAKGAGTISGFLGIKHYEYKQIHKV
jgi:glycosyltransferase involved in cell wall biosynthesis